MGLEEVASVLGALKDAQDAEDGEGEVINGAALAGDAGVFDDGFERREQSVFEQESGDLAGGFHTVFAD